MTTSNTNLGIDLLLDDSGDLTISPTGDLALTSNGRVALLQDVRHVLDTLPGDLYGHPQYGAGLPRLFGEEDQTNHSDLVRRAIIDALTYDPSVAPRIEPDSIEVEEAEGSTAREPAFTVTFTPLGEEWTNSANFVWGSSQGEDQSI